MAILGATIPQTSEYDPYYTRYVALVPQQPILSVLGGQATEMAEILGGITDEQASFRYAPGKWTIKQVLGHIMDTERVFAYRALRIARDDRTPLEGFEQDDYVAHGPFETVSLAELLREYTVVRQATTLLFRHLSPEAWNRRGTANQAEVTVRALAYIIAGHQAHHCRMLRERYLLLLRETGQAVGKS
ncbi:MAG: DinB family protein [Acidobacteria bacterium]|nr:DinB family protein [Acidobacteriota bacterium]MBV8891433.1 DinB family protein [Acidobacteriota bacterium]